MNLVLMTFEWNIDSFPKFRHSNLCLTTFSRQSKCSVMGINKKSGFDTY